MTVRPSDAWESLFRAQVSIMRDLRDEFNDVGMSMNEYDVMFNVHRAPNHQIRLRDLNSNVLITQSSVSRLVDRLVSRGLMTKLEDEFDARGTIVSLTETGTEAFGNASKVHQRNISKRLSAALSPSEITTLNELCVRLREDGSSSGAAAG